METSMLRRGLHAFVKPDTPGPERERRSYLALCLLAALVLFTSFLIAYSLDGKTAEARADLILIVVMCAALALNRLATDPSWALRLATAGVLGLFLWALYTGAGGGFAYVWFFLLPAPALYLFGEREGSLWIAVSLAASAVLLMTPLGPGYPPALALRFTVSYGVVAGLAVALERSRARLRAELTAGRVQVRSALEEVETLSGLIPVCAWCRKVRDDEGYWSLVDEYLARRSGARVTHGICPECATTV